jgi:hypothetical protein
VEDFGNQGNKKYKKKQNALSSLRVNEEINKIKKYCALLR